MQQIAELIPIALFFIVFFMKGTEIDVAGFHYELDGMYSATAVLIVATTLQVLLTWLVTRKLEKRLVLLFLVVVITGGLTLILQNKIFIQWKPTLFNWALALAFIGSQFLGSGKSLLQRTMGTQIELPNRIWARLNYLWITYFIIVGALNLVVAYGFSEDFWVSYKLYSAIGFTLILSVITALMIAPHARPETVEGGKEKQDDPKSAAEP